MNLYASVIKPILFRFDPEFVHDRFVKLGSLLGKFGLAKKILSKLFVYKDDILNQEILGIKFKNPIGLAAGFDKNAELTSVIPSIGFGHMEVGSITNRPYKGNSKPRLWRLKGSKGLIVYYGLKNDGAEIISKKLNKNNFDIPISISIAMTNCKENLDLQLATKDYCDGFSKFVAIGDFFTVNISCPNTEGGQPFMDPQNLDFLLTSLDKIKTQKPIFIKISPDIEIDKLDKILAVAKTHRVDGIICSNLTKNRDNPKIVEKNLVNKGGISGKPVEDIANNLISQIYKKAGDRFVIIGCGGVFSAEDAYKKIRLGASLIHMITGMIFEGPGVIKKINKGLAKLLREDGFKNIKEAVGIDTY